jgi:hypothetical protein
MQSQAMKLSESDILNINAASTPEEAYQIFVLAASKGLGEIAAQALSEAVDNAYGLTENNPNIAGWKKYVRGFSLNASWGSPISLNTAAEIGSITVSGSWSYWLASPEDV